MATPKTVWGIDIGQVALKAVKLRNVEGELQVEAFDIIEHSKILSEPDADQKQLIRSALEQFLARNNVSESLVAVAVPGQSSFTRFVKLPPVDAKKIPDIVRYEAEQQIPFPIDEVIWRWQTFVDPDSPDMEVGIFAMKQIDVHEMLDRFTEVGLNVEFVQMAPLALYNFMMYDGQASPEGATLLADVGAEKTDLVVADGPRMWTRTIQIGGNNFTEALVKAFKLSFSKAEKLKRTATTSKYAKQVFQAMRPVFADLVQEIQRSIGFYTATHRDTRFKRILGLGDGFRLPGLQKFLEQNLNISVVPVDSYNKVTPSPTVSAPQFTENVLSLAVSYGLALQGLGMSAIKTNLLPQEIATKRTWARKRMWFAASAAALLLALAMPWYDDTRIVSALNDDSRAALLKEATEKVHQEKEFQNQSSALKTQIDNSRKEITKFTDLFKYRLFWPSLQAMVWQSLSDKSVAPDQKRVEDYINATDDKDRQLKLDALREKTRALREYFVIDSMTVEYCADTTGRHVNETAGGGAAPAAANSGTAKAVAKPGFVIFVQARTPMPEQTTLIKIDQDVKRCSYAFAAQNSQFEIVDFNLVKDRIGTMGLKSGAISGTHAEHGKSTSAPVGPRYPDPLLPEEDMFDDTQFVIGWVVAMNGTPTGGNADKTGK
jgi:type IV pilus assembly protein PilM